MTLDWWLRILGAVIECGSPWLSRLRWSRDPLGVDAAQGSRRLSDGRRDLAGEIAAHATWPGVYDDWPS
jgi:hypothetical protein